jgi:hypothetical protein
VVARNGGFDLLVSLNTEKDGGEEARIAARRVEIGAHGVSVVLGTPKQVGENAHSGPRGTAAGDTLGLCYAGHPPGGTRGQLQLRTFGPGASYTERAIVDAGDDTNNCDGLAFTGGTFITTTTTTSGDAIVQRWDSRGQLLSVVHPWAADSAAGESIAYTAAIAIDGGLAIAAARGTKVLGSGPEADARIEVQIFPDAGEVIPVRFETALAPRMPELAPWPYAPGGVVAVWREVAEDDSFQLRLAAASVTGDVLLAPTTVASSLAGGTPAKIGVVNEKLFVASVVVDAPGALQVSLRSVQADGTVLDDFRLDARDAIGLSGPSFAGLGDRLLLAWTTSEPGDATYRWVGVNAALLQAR